MVGIFAVAKLGEDVCIHRTGWDGLTIDFQVGKIEKITKTQVTAMGRRWMRSTGREVGCNGDYRSPKLERLTDEIAAQVERDKTVLSAKRKIIQLHDATRKVGKADAVKVAALIPDDLMEALGADK